LIIEDITNGWLVINIWHNAQYILFVWLFNTNRYRGGVDSKAHFLSTISQPQNIFRYLFFCFAVGTLVYLSIMYVTAAYLVAGLPLAILFCQAVNFHHYIVDSQIWKVRKKPMQATMGVSPT